MSCWAEVVWYSTYGTESSCCQRLVRVLQKMIILHIEFKLAIKYIKHMNIYNSYKYFNGYISACHSHSCWYITVSNRVIKRIERFVHRRIIVSKSALRN